jgi:mono/diheme cytochrome c family protein
VVGAVVLLTAGVFAVAWRPAIGAVAPPERGSLDAATIAQGANLAAIGNCSGCHTKTDGAPYAGGLALTTPFGTVYASNLTPDPATGLGEWSLAAFSRAMRDGIARDGRHLYPAFPYDHFTRARDADLAALYAFLMTRTPVVAQTPGFRPLVAGWNLLFLDERPVTDVPAQSADWNRGAYLTDALAHCSACHSPRNALGAERREVLFSGGDAEGWYAPPLNAGSPSPLPWAVDALTRYLQTGLTPDHAIAGGPMQGVTAELAKAAPDDVRAIATYVVALMGTPDAARTQRADASRVRAQQPLALPPPGDAQMALGASVYDSACATCHALGRRLGSGGALRLPLAVAVHDADPRSLLHIVRDGIAPTDGRPGRVMPAFGGTLTDDQLAALAAYLRASAAAAPPWPNLAQAVRDSRGPQ